mgnify:FL=1
MAMQKGLNKNRNHHDSLSQSGSGRFGSDSRGGTTINNAASPVYCAKKNEYGQGKHSKGGKPKQRHW